MRVFAIRIERPFDVAVQRPQHANAGMHQEVAALPRQRSNTRSLFAIL
jgi:hypothetical protein